MEQVPLVAGERKEVVEARRTARRAERAAEAEKAAGGQCGPQSS